MFIELTTHKGEKITFNTANIVLIAPDKKGTVIVETNGIDWVVLESYESIKDVLGTRFYDESLKMFKH